MRLLRQFVGGSPATPVEKELGKLGAILAGHAGNKEQLCLTFEFMVLCTGADLLSFYILLRIACGVRSARPN